MNEQLMKVTVTKGQRIVDECTVPASEVARVRHIWTQDMSGGTRRRLFKVTVTPAA